MQDVRAWKRTSKPVSVRTGSYGARVIRALFLWNPRPVSAQNAETRTGHPVSQLGHRSREEGLRNTTICDRDHSVEFFYNLDSGLRGGLSSAVEES